MRKLLGTVLAFVLLAGTQALAQDDPEIPPAGETQTYKGFTLIGTTYKDRSSRDFFRIARLAIDMVDDLPEADWNRTQVVRTIYYNPPSKYRAASPKDNITATYVMTGLYDYPGPIVMYRSAKYASALNLALALVGAGIYAEDHRLFAELHDRITADRSGERPIPATEKERVHQLYGLLHALITQQAPPDVMLKADCRVLISVYNAMKLIHPESLEFNARVRQMNDRGCL